MSAAFAAAVAPAINAQSPVVIRNVTTVDVQTGNVRPAQTVVVEGTLIKAVGDAADLAAPKGARIVDATGKFLIPGLWDMHVHATGPGVDRLFLPVLVANGVTGVREMFGTFKWYADAREMAKRGEIVMPRLVGSGHILDGKPQIWQSVEVADAAQTRRAVDSLARGGAAFIKVYSRLTPDEFRAAADEAKKHGLTFAGHVPTLVSVDEALSLGMASVEHLQMFTTACSSQEEAFRSALLDAVASAKGWDSAAVIQRLQLPVLPRTFDRNRCTALAKRVAASNTWMVPTVVVLHSTSHLDEPSLRNDPRLQYIPGFFKTGWNPASDFRFKAVTPEGWAARKRIFDEQLGILKILHDAGAKFLAGTDLSNPYLYPGFSLYDELAYFTKNGFSNLEALQTATINPARFLNATDSLGTIAVGKLADLVVLDANPLVDIGNIARVHAVIANGVLIDAGRRQQILKNAVSLANTPSLPRLHHVGLNSVDPEKAIAWYLALWPSATRATVAGYPAVKADMLLLFNKVDRPAPAAWRHDLHRAEPQSAFWHIGANINSTDTKERLSPLGVFHLPLFVSPGDTTKTVWRSGLAPYAGTPNAAQVATAPPAPPRDGGFSYVVAPDGVLFELTGGPTTRASLSHIHFYHEQPLCAANWYVEHLGMELPPVRDSSGKESPRAPWNPCEVPYGEAGWPSLEPIGTIRQPQGSVRFGNGTMSWYPRQCVGTRCGREQKLVPSRGQVLDHVAFEVDDFDAVYAKVRRDGVKILETPHAFGDTRAFMIEDPDGLAIELVASRS